MRGAFIAAIVTEMYFTVTIWS